MAASPGGASVSPTRTSPGCTWRRCGELAATVIEIAPGEQHKTLADAERVWRALAVTGMTPADHARRPRWRRRRRPRGLLRGDLPPRACRSSRSRRRSSPRSTPRSAARPASTCPRARTTSAPTTSPPPCCIDPATLETLPERRAGRGLGRGGQDGADRRRRAVGARERRRARRRRDPRLRPREARDRRPGRARLAAAARCSTSATRSATRSRPRPDTPATATARRSAWACWPRCDSRAPCAARRGRRAARLARAADDARRRRPRAGGRAHCARQEAPRRRAGALRPGRRARGTSNPGAR